MELKGKLEQKLAIEKGTSKAGKEWSKQTVIINNGDQYNPNTAISFFGDDKVKMLDKYSAGQEVSIAVNISSKEFNGKWYNQIDGWKISGATASTPNPELNNSDTDDLPF
tara:strand:- start:2668 stop:2997 length:330 start_codon:yes stop_codon:yes gene_type:complete